MGNLYKTIMILCDERGIKGAKMCNDVGISKGLLTDLKMGRRTGVSAVTAQKIASYFGVSVGYLLGEEEMPENEEKPATTPGYELSRLQDRIMQEIQSAPEDLQKEFLNYLLFSKAQREK